MKCTICGYEQETDFEKYSYNVQHYAPRMTKRVTFSDIFVCPHCGLSMLQLNKKEDNV